MAAVALESEEVDLFDIEAPSPLPRVSAGNRALPDPIARAEQDVARADATNAPDDERAIARLGLSEAWLDLSAVGQALEVVRQAANLAPHDRRVLARLGELLARSGAHREAGAALARLARETDDLASWLAAARSLARAEADDELDRLVDEIVARAPNEPLVRSFAIEVARRRAGDPRLVQRLTDAMESAGTRGDPVSRLVFAVDAWIESKGLVAGLIVAESLLDRGDPRAALVVAVDAAARTIQQGQPTDTARLLMLAARAASTTGLAAEQTALMAVAALFTREAAVRETSRDLFAESGRDVDLAARLCVDARRETDPTRAAAAWKGVAAVERAFDANRAAFALAEAVSHVPNDEEALAALAELARKPDVAPTVADALAWATRAELGDVASRRALYALRVRVEESVGDPAAALAVASHAWKAGAAEFRTTIDRHAQEGEQLFERADDALLELETAPPAQRAAALEQLLANVGTLPGAFRDLSRATQVLMPFVGADGRASSLWLRLTRRLGDRAALLSALRRIATRSTVRVARARAAVELAEWLDLVDSESGSAFEVLELVLDEQPDSVDAVATLVALAEHSTDLRVDRAAIAAMAKIAHDPGARELLARLAGGAGDSSRDMTALARMLDGTGTPAERIEALREWSGRLVDAPALLARRVRAAMAAAIDAREAAEIARRFAEAAPLSAEANIAWFGTAGVSGDAHQVADAAVGVLHSLASSRDAANVAKAAISRLMTLDESTLAMRVARQAAQTIGFSERPLRLSVIEYAQRQQDRSAAVEVIEAAVASATGAPSDQSAGLRMVARLHRERDDDLAEMYALRRLVALVPAEGDSLARLATILSSRGELPSLARILSLRIASETEIAAKRTAALLLAAVHLAQGERDTALVTLDRLADETGDGTTQGDVMRALLAANEHEAAVTRLTRWADKSESPTLAVQMYRAAARILHTRGADPARAIALLRSGLTRAPESPDLLLLAEEIGVQGHVVRAMLGIYADLDALAAGEHGRRALAYRRASFLERCGEYDEALAGYQDVFDNAPVGGATFTAIERLARRTGHIDAIVRCLRRLADVAVSTDLKVRHLLTAARISREDLHDRRSALDLTLLAHEERRDPENTEAVLEVARSLKSLDASAFRSAVETVFDRTIAVAEEVWDDDRKRELALRAAEIAINELSDGTRAARAVATFIAASEDASSARTAALALLDKPAVPASVREAVQKAIAPQGATISVAASTVLNAPSTTLRPAAIATPDVARRVEEMARGGDIAAALKRARDELEKKDDESLRAAAVQIAREHGDASAELGLIEYRLDRLFDVDQRVPLVLRVAELMRGPLGRIEEARTRLRAALADCPDDHELLRATHDLAEHFGDWTEVANLLSRRIARATDRAEARALRLHRAAVLEQRFGDVAGAILELESILEDEPAHRPALRYLADLHLREKRFADAGQCFARAAASTPLRSEASDLLSMAGEAFVQGAENTAADGQFRRALELEPRSVRAQQGLLDVSRRLGRLDEAERILAAMAEASENERDQVALRLAAARAALGSGALYRAKSHLDAVRRTADPTEVAELEAVLQAARDNDRPISQSRMNAVQARAAAALPPSSPASGPNVGSEPPGVPRSIDPATQSAIDLATRTAQDSGNSSAAIPLARTKSTPTPPPAPSVSPSGTARRSITPRPLPSAQPAPVPEAVAPPDPIEQSEPTGYEKYSDSELREACDRGDDDAARALGARLARHENTRIDAIRVQRARFQRDPTRIGALEAMVGLFQMLGRGSEARGVRAVIDTLTGRAPSVTPPDLHTLPDLPADAAGRMIMAGDVQAFGEIGSAMWEALGNSLKRDVSAYGVTGVDRIAASAPTDVARMFASAVRVLQVPRVSLFVRSEVHGGAMPARTQPPSVILAAPLAADTAVSRFMLAQALEATRPGNLLVATLDAEEAGHAVRALLGAFGTSHSMAGSGPAAGRMARVMVESVPLRVQRRISELLADLERADRPFTHEAWQAAAECARNRAGLLVSGEFEIAARIVVSRVRHGGGEPDVVGALATLEALRDLARFAVSEQYLLTRWRPDQVLRPWR